MSAQQSQQKHHLVSHTVTILKLPKIIRSNGFSQPHFDTRNTTLEAKCATRTGNLVDKPAGSAPAIMINYYTRTSTIKNKMLSWCSTTFTHQMSYQEDKIWVTISMQQDKLWMPMSMQNCQNFHMSHHPPQIPGQQLNVTQTKSPNYYLMPY